MDKNINLKYRRILLKLSGEALRGDAEFGIDLSAVENICVEIADLIAMGVQVAVVIGGGNLFRGAELTKRGLDRITGDHMGMLATIMNGLALRERFLKAKIPVTLMSSFSMPGIVESFDRRLAINALEAGKVVIFVGGTGNPLFSTDSAASLRAIEIKADALLKATKVDGVYSADPNIDKNAKRFDHLTYAEVLDRQLGVMDLTAICLAKEFDLTIRVFDMNKPSVLKHVVMGNDEGTVISGRF